jgi:uncharacterized protein YqeY
MVGESQLQGDLQAAMKARAMEKVYVLRDVITAIKNLKVEKQVPALAEADVVAIIRKEMNKRREAAEFAQKAGRAELVAKNEAECAILQAYLPQQLDAEALAAVVRTIAAELATTQIGPIMAKLRERHAGQFDGKLASELIRKLG